MDKPFISLIGLEDDGYEQLSQEEKNLIHKADILIGGKRHFDMLPSNFIESKAANQERWLWSSPLSKTVQAIVKSQDKNIAILATGDPFCYGIGSTLSKKIPLHKLKIFPKRSAFSLAANRLGWAQEHIEYLSLHGRHLNNLGRLLYPGARILILSHDRKTPKDVAEYLKKAGFHDLRFFVLEHMGGKRERIIEVFSKDNLDDIADFNTIALEIPNDPSIPFQSKTIGLDDHHFFHDGNITKRDIRINALSKLKPHPGAILWDVGAGCGSISVEWCRLFRNARAIAIEHNKKRIEFIKQNIVQFGLTDLKIIAEKAPGCFHKLQKPDAIFIGGGLDEEILEMSLQVLPNGGRLVTHSVTLESEALLLKAYQNFKGEISRLSLSYGEDLGSLTGWKGLRTITQWSFIKGSELENRIIDR